MEHRNIKLWIKVATKIIIEQAMVRPLFIIMSFQIQAIGYIGRPRPMLTVLAMLGSLISTMAIPDRTIRTASIMYV